VTAPDATLSLLAWYTTGVCSDDFVAFTRFTPTLLTVKAVPIGTETATGRGGDVLLRDILRFVVTNRTKPSC